MVNSKPLVSVIIPAYNQGHFIGRAIAIESALHQTYPPEGIEIIVVDDGSGDNTFEVIKKYIEHIIYLPQENRGIASARNRGIESAGGEIITFLDSDDIWIEERLSRVVALFQERNDIGIVYHPFELINYNGSIIYKNFYQAFGYREGIEGWITNSILSDHIFCGGSSFAINKNTVDMVYPIPEDIRRGVDYYLTVLSSCYAQAAYLPENLSQYRFHGENTTMFSGKNSLGKLALVNRDFAHLRERLIEKLKGMGEKNLTIDLDSTMRRYAKEMVFYYVLAGKRLKGIKEIPLLYRGNISKDAFIKEFIISLMAIFIPSFLYPYCIRAFDALKRMRYIIS